MDDVVREFLVESREGTEQMEQDLVALERDPSSRELIARIFRVIHTIKGTCGFLGFDTLQAVTHAAESLLSRLRDGELEVTSEIADSLLTTLDIVRTMLGVVESTGSDGSADISQHVAWLERLREGKPAAPTPPVTPWLSTTSPPPVGAPEPDEAPAPPEAPVAEAPPPAEVASPPTLAQPEIDEVVSAAALPSGSAAGNQPQTVMRAATDSQVRVDVALLDGLMNLVGELVLTRNEMMQLASGLNNTTGTSISQKLNLITTQLQEGVLKTRMQPLGTVWNKMPRVVRDLAAALGKEVRLEMEGEETELDRTLNEAIRDPLTHMIRNAVDHGLEMPAERVKKGKPREGRLQLRARHQAGQVVIEISDDGAGIDFERVKKKAVSRGLISAEQARRMGDREAAELIFLPGLSTAEKVTEVSGRGVGMDVVKSNIKRVNGNVEIDSRLGEGTTFKIRLPLTLAILPALVVTAGQQRFVIPQASLLELVRLEGERAAGAIEMFQGVPVFRLRGDLKPIVSLARELGLPERERAAEDTLYIVVLQVEERQFCLVVDAINDAHEIVVKPLGKQLRGLSIYAGATILGDGEVALILDVEGLARQAHVVREVEHVAGSRGGSTAGTEAQARQTVVLCRTVDDGRMAIPLSRVSRLEHFELERTEWAGGTRVVQYRGEIMPLVALDELVDLPRRTVSLHSDEPATPPMDNGIASLILHSPAGNSFGVTVEEIVDIVEVGNVVGKAGHRRGVMGSMVIQGRVTEVLDVRELVLELDQRFPTQRSGLDENSLDEAREVA